MKYSSKYRTEKTSHGVKAKKYLGQHFLHNEQIARDIAESIVTGGERRNILEIGPGTGILSRCLWERPELNVKLVELDEESVDFLRKQYPEHCSEQQLLFGDFLKMDLNGIFQEPFDLVGNFPYNISSQILFRVWENYGQIPQVVGMFQKEVAERVAASPGSKTYGILSVLLQAFYQIDYLFTVEPFEFTPPPQVKSGVIRLVRNQRQDLDCDRKLFAKVVKAAFNQRRKTLRNALKPLVNEMNPQNSDAILESIARFLDKRAEQLSVEDFLELCKKIEGESRGDTPTNRPG